MIIVKAISLSDCNIMMFIEGNQDSQTHAPSDWYLCIRIMLMIHAEIH